MKSKILLLIWFGSTIVLADRDLLQQPGITPVITSSWHYPDWSAEKILSNYSQINVFLCQCCAVIVTPGYIHIDLRQTYSVSRIDVFGRRDEPDGSEFNNTVLKTHNGESIPISSKNYTFLSAKMYPYQMIQHINISSLYQSGAVMTICNVKVYGPDYLTGFPTQSSVYNGDCTAEKALNGIEDRGFGDIQLCQACSVTAGANPWWSLDLGGEHLIGSIQVVGSEHSDHNYGLQVSVANPLLGSNIVIPGNISKFGLDQQINPPRLARSINITTVLITQEYMALCEVKIFETDCPNGTYGDRCAGNCRHCKGGFTQCDHVYGTCKLGCEIGYKGSLCLHSCNTRSYGENCTKPCGNCLDGSRCDLKNGSCPRGCSPGYFGIYCNQTCTTGNYGLACQNSCGGNCRNNETCNFINGLCSFGCVAGFDFITDNTCGQACADGWYGQGCSIHCGNCSSGAICDKVSGDCPSGGCEPGYTGLKCDQDKKQFQSQKTGGGNIAIAVLTTLLVVSIIGNMIAVIINCRRKARKSHAKNQKTDENNYAVPGESVASDYTTLDVAESMSLK